MTKQRLPTLCCQLYEKKVQKGEGRNDAMFNARSLAKINPDPVMYEE